MAKELPYFRFTVQEWQNGDVTLESYEIQGIFINICCYYWMSNCEITLAKLKQRLRVDEATLEILMEKEIISVDLDTDLVEIKFLNEQWEILKSKSDKLSKAGKKGYLAKVSKAKARLKGGLSYKEKYKDKDNNKEKEVKEDKNLILFDVFRKKYPGTKRGNETEFKNFQKKHKDWKEVLPLLEKSIDIQIEERRKLTLQKQSNKNIFIPQWKNLQTWINQRCWEESIAIEGEYKQKDVCIVCGNPAKGIFDNKKHCGNPKCLDNLMGIND
jgi:hypothetical protein